MLIKKNLEGQIYIFTCHARYTKKNAEWIARLTFVSASEFPYEAIVSVDGYSYTFLLGHYINGFYISIPSLYKSADLTSPGDFLYNREALMKAGLSRRLATTFARALQLFDADHHGGCQERDYQSEELIARQNRLDEAYLPFAQ